MIGAACGGPGFKGFIRFKGFRGLWYRPSGDEYIYRLTAAGKPYNRACGALEMHPYPRLRRYFS